MPALRSNLRRLALAAAVCLATVVPAFRPVETSAAASLCPIQPPTPLRMLFKDSDRVVVARAGNSEREKSDNSDSFRRTTFHISESLKGGNGENTLQVVHYTYPDSPEYVGNFNKGDRLLLFLSRNEEQDVYGVYDMRHGAKKLSDEDLKIYLKRIEELSALMLREKVDDAEIVEWLVRCAEEPATRWEGAYELNAGLSIARNEARAAESKGTEAEAEEESEEAEEGESEESGEQSTEAEADEVAAPDLKAEEGEAVTTSIVLPSIEEAVGSVPSVEIKTIRFDMFGTDIAPEAVANMTQEQKTRLANALFRADKVGEGEMTLLEVVKEWGDVRLVPFLTNHLRGLEKDPPAFAAELMSVLADALKDKALARLVENYVENAPDEDDYEGEESEESEDDEGAASENVKRSSDENKKKISAAEKRGEMLREFLAAVENRIQYDLAMQLSR